MKEFVLFDWGNTLMREFPYPGPMVSWPRVELIPQVAEVLEQLRGEFLCCVASNAGHSDAEMMGSALARVGIRPFFHRLFTEKELGTAKPDPAFFYGILRELGAEPQECIMVGNDYLKDIASAKSVGIRTILFAEASPEGLCPEADVIIHAMSELLPAIRQLQGGRKG